MSDALDQARGVRLLEEHRARARAEFLAEEVALDEGAGEWTSLDDVDATLARARHQLAGTNGNVRSLIDVLATTRICLVDAVRTWDTEVGWAYDGALSPQAWLTSRCGVSRAEASQLVGVAQLCRKAPEANAALHGRLLRPATLDDRRDPTIDVDDDGKVAVRLSFEQLVTWTRVVTPERTALFIEHAETALLACEGLTLQQTAGVAHAWAQYADDELGTGRPDDRYERRHLEITRYDDGRVRIVAVLDPDTGESFITAVESMDRPDPDDHPGGPRSRGQRYADHLGELAHRYNAGLLRAEPGKVGNPTHQVLGIVHTDGSAPPQLIGGSLIDPGLAELYACTALVSRVVIGTGGEVLEMGRAARLFTAAQTKAIVARDRHCQFPGCDRPPSWCDVHHLRHWEHGGTTDLANGVLLCHQHHRLLHAKGWALERVPTGQGRPGEGRFRLDRFPSRPPSRARTTGRGANAPPV